MDLASHQLDQAVGDREAQAGSSIAAGDRGVRLGEGLEQPLLVLGSDADPGVLDGEAERASRAPRPPPARPGGRPSPRR